MQEQLIKQAQIISKSKLPDDAKEFLIFIISQFESIEKNNAAKIKENIKLEKLKEWHENESIFYEMSIKNGLRNGPFKMWNISGKLLCDIEFVNNEICGQVKLYKKDDVEEVYLFEKGIPKI